MSHNNQPEYFTISSICPHSGDITQLGIFENMRAVSYRLQRMYTSCGDEYRVECFHLSTAEAEAEAYTEQTVNRAKYKREEEMKEARLQEWQEYKDKEDEQAIEDCKNAQPDSAEVLIDQLEQIADKIKVELPNIKAEHQTVEV